MRVGGSQEGKLVFWTTRWGSLDKFLLLSVALTQPTSGLVQSASVCVGLKKYRANVLMELRLSASCCTYWQGKATGTVLCVKEERCTSWKEAPIGSSGQVTTPPQSLLQDLSVLLLCHWRNVGLPCGCKWLIFSSLQTSAGCV